MQRPPAPLHAAIKGSFLVMLAQFRRPHIVVRESRRRFPEIPAFGRPGDRARGVPEWMAGKRISSGLIQGGAALSLDSNHSDLLCNRELQLLQLLFTLRRQQHMSHDQEKDEWVRRELGMNPTAPARAFDPLPVWQAAREKAEAEFAALQETLSEFEDDDADFLANFPPALAFEQVEQPILALLNSFAEASTAKVDAGEMAAQLDRERKALRKQPILSLIDQNPFGIALSTAAILEAALTEIAGHMQAGESR